MKTIKAALFAAVCLVMPAQAEDHATASDAVLIRQVVDVCGFTLTTKAREELLRAINAAVDGEIAYANARVRADRVKFGNDKIWCRLAFSVCNNLFVPNSNTPW